MGAGVGGVREADGVPGAGAFGEGEGEADLVLARVPVRGLRGAAVDLPEHPGDAGAARWARVWAGDRVSLGVGESWGWDRGAAHVGGDATAAAGGDGGKDGGDA